MFKFLLISTLAIVLLMSDEASANAYPRWEKLNDKTVCFGARDNQFGRFSFNRNIFVSQFMLVHRTGTVSCDKKNYSYWGCLPNHVDLNVVLTDQQNKILAPDASAVNSKHGWYGLSGYTSSSSALVFSAPKKPHCYFANSELRLWYGEDLKGYTESDNAGKTCADVYGLLA